MFGVLIITLIREIYFDLDVSSPSYNIDKGNFLSCMILPLGSRCHEFNFRNALLHYPWGEMFELRSKTWLVHEFNMIILLTVVFVLVPCFSLRVRDIPSWILGMPNFTNIDKRCLNSILKAWLLYDFEHCYIIEEGIWSSSMIFTLGASGPEFKSLYAPFHSSRQKVFEFRTKNMLLYEFEHGSIIDDDISSRCPKFNSWNAPVYKLRWKVCEFYLSQL